MCVCAVPDWYSKITHSIHYPRISIRTWSLNRWNIAHINFFLRHCIVPLNCKWTGPSKNKSSSAVGSWMLVWIVEYIDTLIQNKGRLQNPIVPSSVLLHYAAPPPPPSSRPARTANTPRLTAPHMQLCECVAGAVLVMCNVTSFQCITWQQCPHSIPSHRQTMYLWWLMWKTW